MRYLLLRMAVKGLNPGLEGLRGLVSSLSADMLYSLLTCFTCMASQGLNPGLRLRGCILSLLTCFTRC